MAQDDITLTCDGCLKKGTCEGNHQTILPLYSVCLEKVIWVIMGEHKFDAFYKRDWQASWKRDNCNAKSLCKECRDARSAAVLAEKNKLRDILFTLVLIRARLLSNHQKAQLRKNQLRLVWESFGTISAPCSNDSDTDTDTDIALGTEDGQLPFLPYEIWLHILSQTDCSRILRAYYSIKFAVPIAVSKQKARKALEQS